MKTKIQSLHFDADKKLLDYIEKKMDKLYRMNNRIEDCDVILKMEKNDTTKNKVVEIKLNYIGHLMFVEDQSESFEMATDMAVHEMNKQLIKHKEKVADR